MTSFYRLAVAWFCLSVFAAVNDPANTKSPQLPPENYSWTETLLDSLAASKFTIQTRGKVDPGGFTSVSMDLGSRTIQGYRYENKAYVSCAQRNWRSEPLLRNDETPGEFMARLVRRVIPPATELDLILKNGDKLKKDGELLSADLPPGLVSKFLDQGTGRPAKTKRKDPSGTGTVKIWTKDGAVTKYEIKLSGKVEIDGKETDVDRTRTIEITDVGTTTIDLPDQARKKFGLGQPLR
jgi:hypothetical protein